MNHSIKAISFLALATIVAAVTVQSRAASACGSYGDISPAAQAREALVAHYKKQDCRIERLRTFNVRSISTTDSGAHAIVEMTEDNNRELLEVKFENDAQGYRVVRAETAAPLTVAVMAFLSRLRV